MRPHPGLALLLFVQGGSLLSSVFAACRVSAVLLHLFDVGSLYTC